LSREIHKLTEEPEFQRELRQKLRGLPPDPGVYLMKDAKGKVIYVGKARRLASRVRSYFQDPAGLDRKTARLVQHIRDFDWVAAPSEKDAILLEDQLIKEYRPRYNIRLKDDKAYPYLRLTSAEAYPRLDVVRRPERDGNEYFGPYTNAGAMRLTLKALTGILPVRTCALDLPKETVPRPCLDYYIKRCCAPCVDYVTQDDYASLIDEVRLFLQGRSRHLVDRLREEMEAASEALDFEEAARIRDRVSAMEEIARQQKSVLQPGDDADVLAMEREGREAVGVVLRVRDGKLVRSEDYHLRSTLADERESFFERFVAEVLSRSSTLSRTILLEESIAEPELRAAALKEAHGHPVRIEVPQRGHRVDLVRMARQTANTKMRERIARAQPKRARELTRSPGVGDLKERLGLAVAPHTIECFDMSHFQGTQRVGSLVFFSGGQPLKSRYRRFRIKEVDGIDDFAMMKECLERYYSRLRDEDKVPADLVVVDGGAGQLSMGVSTLRRYGFVETAIIGLAKREEEVYIPGEREPVQLPRTSEALKLLQRVRDEAHRFAITYHRSLRDKETLRSALDEIPGIGQVKRRSLLSAFGSAEAVGKASAEELERVPGIGPKDVQRIAEFFLARGGQS
jgi:excinuclease ABC subunit C